MYHSSKFSSVLISSKKGVTKIDTLIYIGSVTRYTKAFISKEKFMRICTKWKIFTINKTGKERIDYINIPSLKFFSFYK